MMRMTTALSLRRGDSGRRRVPAVLAALAVTAALSTALTEPAAAATPGPHDPFGSVASVAAIVDGLAFTGWAADPDALSSNDSIAVIVDGRKTSASARTSLANKSVSAKYKTGPTPGFTISTAVPSGAHTVCVVARTIGTGLDTVLKCVTTPLSTKLSSAQIAAHQPAGVIAHSWATATRFYIEGWASDPDDVNRPSIVVLYLDGRPAATLTTRTYAAPRPAKAGTSSAYYVSVPIAAGMHVGCVWAVNVGLGAGNTFQGCRSRDSRGPAGTARVAVPALNTKVLTEAKTHLGQRYVWGATGPRTFDCSGLVMYSYGKFGYRTPRVSEDQAVRARLIPASRAVPGDLVFYHDTEGDVYHVGIYVSPGRTVAAIDPQEGVRYQTIWDPSITTYGAFTHT
jgi:cell wall-associated NlpC family hydrolase